MFALWQTALVPQQETGASFHSSRGVHFSIRRSGPCITRAALYFCVHALCCHCCADRIHSRQFLRFLTKFIFHATRMIRFHCCCFRKPALAPLIRFHHVFSWSPTRHPFSPRRRRSLLHDWDIFRWRLIKVELTHPCELGGSNRARLQPGPQHVAGRRYSSDRERRRGGAARRPTLLNVYSREATRQVQPSPFYWPCLFRASQASRLVPKM